MIQNIIVTIQYKTYGDVEWRTFNINAQSYFDIEENEKIEVDSIPLYNHAIDYINNDQVTNTKITIEDQSTHSKVVITESFWNNQQNRVIERIDFLKNTHDELILVETKIQSEPTVYEIVRLIRKDGILIPEYHGFITDNVDGSQSEEEVTKF